MTHEGNRPRKDLGQHFLHDHNIINKIVAAISPRKEDTLVEIGPGLGAITQELLPLCEQLDVVEIDDAVIDPLQKTCANLGELILHHQDVLTFDFGQFDKKIRLVGNLPYNISSPLIFHVLTFLDQIVDMHFMLQKEVVLRMAAPPGNKTYGRLSVMVQYFCEVAPLFDVKPNSFRPPPKVDSAVVRLVPRSSRPIIANDLKKLSLVVKTAFGQRRKTLRNNLKPLLSAEQLEQLGINPKWRAEQLTVDQFVTIANQL